MRLRSWFAVLWAGLLIAAPLWAEPAPAGSGAPEPGTWHSQKTELVYMGFTSIYSCDGLQGKLELLLRQLGARPGFKVSAYGCTDYGRPSRFVRATLEFATLQPANADSAGTDAASSGASPSDAVSGSWRPVELAPHRPFDLQDGDCELMEQFRDKVLPLFATRGLEIQTNCIPHQDNGGPFDLRMQVFAPVTPPKASAR